MINFKTKIPLNFFNIYTMYIIQQTLKLHSLLSCRCEHLRISPSNFSALHRCPSPLLLGDSRQVILC
ncbi:hypothetical protein C1H46_013765 [Malus baccata]|uniref:Uncharacterized protein n=1 Tax=Malus baccata TaxID=106549 RepID=A0A540MPB6_MALBA|nr:hypothetical protein C1H46_013765 [Malus baccata]